MFELTNISLILFATTAVNFFTAYISWQRRKTKGGIYFAFGMIGVTFWTLTTGLDYSSTSIPLKVFFAKLETIGYNSALALLALFILSYAGHDDWLKKWWVNLSFIILPISNILLAWTNDLHGWLWTGFTASEFGDNVVVFHHGPAFIWVAIVDYLMTAIILINLWQTTSKGSELSRRQARLLFLATIFPVLSNLIYLVNIPAVSGIDWTSITFSITGMFFLIALYGRRLLDIVPIARHTMIEKMTDYILVLDMQNRVMDFNSATQENFNIKENDIGNTVNDVMAAWPEIIAFSLSSPADTVQTIIEKEGKSKVLDMRLTLLEDNRGQLYGKLIVFRDITERYHMEQALEQRLFEIKKLHENLQQTQAQLVEQQRALAILEERQRLGRDMHDSVNQSIHSSMLFSETLVALLEKGQTEKAIQVAERIQESGQQALKEIRLLVYETQSRLADESTDLIGALEERLNMVERRFGIRAEIIFDTDTMKYCPAAWRENLYWMIMEALNNSLKHAKARNIKVLFHCTGEQLEVEVKDDGTGFEPGQARGGGFGMRTMRERAEILGGELSVQSSPGHGTRVYFKAKIGT